MEVSDVLVELVAREKRFPPGLVQADSEPLASEDDLRGWAASTGLEIQTLLDAIAIAIARDYERGALSFPQCDLIVNELYSCALFAEIDFPDVFWAVFNAFDAGEHFHDNDRTKDPEQIYTRPRIREVLRQAQVD